MPRSSEVKIVPNPVSDVRKQTRSVLRATRETKQSNNLVMHAWPSTFVDHSFTCKVFTFVFNLGSQLRGWNPGDAVRCVT